MNGYKKISSKDKEASKKLFKLLYGELTNDFLSNEDIVTCSNLLLKYQEYFQEVNFYKKLNTIIQTRLEKLTMDVMFFEDAVSHNEMKVNVDNDKNYTELDSIFNCADNIQKLIVLRHKNGNQTDVFSNSLLNNICDIAIHSTASSYHSVNSYGFVKAFSFIEKYHIDVDQKYTALKKLAFSLMFSQDSMPEHVKKAQELFSYCRKMGDTSVEADWELGLIFSKFLDKKFDLELSSAKANGDVSPAAVYLLDEKFKELFHKKPQILEIVTQFLRERTGKNALRGLFSVYKIIGMDPKTPEEELNKIIEFFKFHCQNKDYEAIDSLALIAYHHLVENNFEEDNMGKVLEKTKHLIKFCYDCYGNDGVHFVRDCIEYLSSQDNLDVKVRLDKIVGFAKCWLGTDFETEALCALGGQIYGGIANRKSFPEAEIAKAIELLKSAPKNKDVVQTLEGIAHVFSDKKKYKQAINLHKFCYEIDSKSFMVISGLRLCAQDLTNVEMVEDVCDDHIDVVRDLASFLKNNGISAYYNGRSFNFTPVFKKIIKKRMDSKVKENFSKAALLLVELAAEGDQDAYQALCEFLQEAKTSFEKYLIHTFPSLKINLALKGTLLGQEHLPLEIPSATYTKFLKEVKEDPLFLTCKIAVAKAYCELSLLPIKLVGQIQMGNENLQTRVKNIRLHLIKLQSPEQQEDFKFFESRALYMNTIDKILIEEKKECIPSKSEGSLIFV